MGIRLNNWRRRLWNFNKIWRRRWWWM